MKSDRPPGAGDGDLEGFMDEVRPEVAAILERHRIPWSRGVEIVSQAWALVALTDAGRAERKRQFLEALENECRELRAQLGPPEEEEDDEPQVH